MYIRIWLAGNNAKTHTRHIFLKIQNLVALDSEVYQALYLQGFFVVRMSL